MTRYLALWIGIALLGGAVAVGGWGRSSPHLERARPVVRPGPAAMTADARRPAPESFRRAATRLEADTDGPALPSGLHVHPDPSIRLYALEAWALAPDDRLDPVTHALVDPDESVRARAQELLEEMLSQRQGAEPSG